MVNKVILLGYLGQTPEVTTTTSNIKVARLRMATSETFKDKQSGEKKTTTEWHTVVMWRQLADVAEKYLHKGSMVYIEGKITTREWTDKDNNKRYSTEIVADTLKLLPGKSDGEKRDEPAPAAAPDPDPGMYGQNPEDNSDDLPF